MASTAEQVSPVGNIPGGGALYNLNGGISAKAGPVLKHMCCPEETVSESLGSHLHAYDIKNTSMPGFFSYRENLPDMANHFIPQIRQHQLFRPHKC